MGTFEHRLNSGTIFKNDKKTSEKHPDYRGTINVDGKIKSIALWLKKGAKKSFFSAAISDPYQKQTPTPAPAPKPAGEEGLPF